MLAAEGGLKCSTSTSLVGSEEATVASASWMAGRDVGVAVSLGGLVGLLSSKLEDRKYFQFFLTLRKHLPRPYLVHQSIPGGSNLDKPQ